MKSLEFIYQDTQIHFLLGNEGDVMVNATEMAKAFGKRVRNFSRLDSTQEFIEELVNQKHNVDSSHVSYQNFKKEVISGSNKATYMSRILALEFAAWLDLKFKIWVWEKMDEVLFGFLKEYRDAMLDEIHFKNEKETAKEEMLLYPTAENVKRYFEAEAGIKSAKNKKNKASANQLNLFQEMEAA